MTNIHMFYIRAAQRKQCMELVLVFLENCRHEHDATIAHCRRHDQSGPAAITQRTQHRIEYPYICVESNAREFRLWGGQCVDVSF